jgi:hypothetical protein
MYTLIATIIFGGSLIGMGTILIRKIPMLVELPEFVETQKGEDLVLILKDKIKERLPLKDFSYESFLEKLLFKIKILTLKAENKTSSLLQKLRERQNKKTIETEDNYWDQIKKSTTEFSSVEVRGKKRTNSSSPKEK